MSSVRTSLIAEACELDKSTRSKDVRSFCRAVAKYLKGLAVVAEMPRPAWHKGGPVCLSEDAYTAGDMQDFAAASVSAAKAGPFYSAIALRIAENWNLKGNICPVLYSDSINGEQVMRDDLWLATTEALAARPGWVLVPQKPTDAMLDAAARASVQHLLDCIHDPAKADQVGSEENVRKTHGSRFESMLRVLPEPNNRWRDRLQEAIARAKVFDDGSDGADAESARSVVAILTDVLEDPLQLRSKK